MNSQDIRWKIRFQSYLKAIALLEDAINAYRKIGLNELEKQGLIQRFEFTHELAWMVLKDYFEYQGNKNINGSRDAFREAFNKGLIEHGEDWMEMIVSRNQSSHTYDEVTINNLIDRIVNRYFQRFSEFRNSMHLLL